MSWRLILRDEKVSDPNLNGEVITPNKNEKVVLSDLQTKELISLFIWLGFLFGLTIFVKVPLDSSPIAASVSISKAPWVFGSIQWLLKWWPAWLSGWVIPVLSTIVLLSLPRWAQKAGEMWTWIIFLVLSSVWVGLTFMYWLMG